MSDNFPFSIRVTRWRAEHRGGTKFCEINSLARADGGGDRSLLITRWGKILAPGQVQIQRLRGSFSAGVKFNSKLNEKQRRGYTEHVSQVSEIIASRYGLSSFVAPVIMSELDKAQPDVTHLEYLFRTSLNEWADTHDDIISEPPAPAKVEPPKENENFDK